MSAEKGKSGLGTPPADCLGCPRLSCAGVHQAPGSWLVCGPAGADSLSPALPRAASFLPAKACAAGETRPRVASPGPGSFQDCGRRPAGSGRGGEPPPAGESPASLLKPCGWASLAGRQGSSACSEDRSGRLLAGELYAWVTAQASRLGSPGEEQAEEAKTEPLAPAAAGGSAFAFRQTPNVAG